VRIRGVLFDVDETLVDSHGAARTAIGGHLDELGLPSGPAALAHWRELAEFHFGRYLSGELSFGQQRRERVRAMMGRVMTDEEADEWIRGYVRRMESAWAPFPDVVSSVDCLAHLRLGVVTNTETWYQRAKLEQVGLLDRFRCLIGTDTVGVPKPQPEIFHAGCAALDLDAAETVYVGDRLQVDAIGARDAGLVGVWLDRSRTGQAPHGVPVITSLAELPDVLRRHRDELEPAR
jgi:putative hydrolase of the HAD superfamily